MLAKLPFLSFPPEQRMRESKVDFSTVAIQDELFLPIKEISRLLESNLRVGGAKKAVIVDRQ